jgi:tetratricopeptide (TPR) repeat protein
MKRLILGTLLSFVSTLVAQVAAPAPGALPALRKDDTIVGGEISTLLAELHSAENAGNKPLQANVLCRLAAANAFIGNEALCDEHAARAGKLTVEAHGSDSIEYARQLHHWSSLIMFRRRYDIIEVNLRKALPIMQAKLQGDHAEVMEVRQLLALALMRQAKTAEAKKLLDDYLDASRKLYGEDSSEHTLRMGIVANIYNQGDLGKEAEDIARLALERFDKAGEKDTDAYSSVLNSLGGALIDQNRPADAEIFLRRSHAIAVKLHGADSAAMIAAHNNLAIAISNVAETEDDKKRLSEAEDLYRKSLKLAEQAYGPKHAMLAPALGNLANTLRATGKFAEAEKHLRRAMAIQNEVLSPRDIARNATRMALVSLLRVMGRLVDAEKLCDETLTQAEATFGREHSTYADVLHERGALLATLNRGIEAEQAYWEATSIRKKTLGPDHADVARSLSNVALLCDARGDHKNAEGMCRRVVEIERKAHGADSFLVARALDSLAANLKGQKRYGEAEKVLRERLAVLQTKLGSEHANLGEAMRDVAIVLMEDKRYVEAVGMLRRGLAIHRAALGDNHPRAGHLMTWLAVNLMRSESYTDSERIARECYLLFSRKPANERPDDAMMGQIRDINQGVMSHLKVKHAEIMDRLDLMREGTDPGPPKPGKSASET